MKIHKITEASEYLGVSINTLKTLANEKLIKEDKMKTITNECYMCDHRRPVPWNIHIYTNSFLQVKITL